MNYKHDSLKKASPAPGAGSPIPELASDAMLGRAMKLLMMDQLTKRYFQYFLNQTQV